MSCIERPFKYSSLSGGSIRSSWYVSFLYRYSNHNSACTTLQKCHSTGPSRILKRSFLGALHTHQRHHSVCVHGALLSLGRSTMGITAIAYPILIIAYAIDYSNLSNQAHTTPLWVLPPPSVVLKLTVSPPSNITSASPGSTTL